MDEQQRFLIWLAQFGLGSKKTEAVFSQVQSLSQFKNAKALDKILKYDQLQSMLQQADERAVAAYFDALEKQNITVLCKFLPGYPRKLVDLPDCPIFLFCKGDISLLDRFSIAIIGTRKPNNYGRIVTEEFAGQIAKSGAVVISGLAYGVDSIAHRRALEVGGSTIAVLGSGFNHIYPSDHTALANEIAQKGLLISEYCPSVEPTRYTFVERNRIIAGLSDGVLITQAGAKSGTRLTKDYALDYGKDVFAVPGSIKDSLSELPNKLISCGHAKCVLDAQDVVGQHLTVERQTKKPVEYAQTIEEQLILKLLSDGEKDLEYILEKSGLDAKNAQSCLTLLEIRGIIKKLPGNFYAAI